MPFTLSGKRNIKVNIFLLFFGTNENIKKLNFFLKSINISLFWKRKESRFDLDDK
jgi:hypothetical protein